MTTKIYLYEGKGVSDGNVSIKSTTAVMFNGGGMKFVCGLMNKIHTHTEASVGPGVFGEGIIYLQTEGTRVPEHAGDEAQAEGWSPLQTAPLCAAPGCPRYLKTESEQRGDAKTMARRGRKEREDEESRIEEEKGPEREKEMDKDVE